MIFHITLMVPAGNSLVAATLLPYVLVVLGGIMILGPAFQWWQDAGISRWPSVEGKVLSSDVEIREEYQPKILYEYTVRGVTHQGTEIASHPRTSYDRVKAEKLIARFPPGETVRVFYDPGNPQTSVLDRTPYSRPLLAVWIAMGALLAALGIMAHLKVGGAEGSIWEIGVRLFTVVGFLGLFGSGLFLIFWALRKGWRWHTCKSWPSVEGRVVRSSVFQGSFTPRTAYRISTGVSMEVAEPSVTYEYWVDGDRYEGSEISNSFYWSRAKRAEEIVARHPQGGKVRVYFNPDNPQRSLLDPTPGGALAHLVLLFIVFVGIFLLLIPVFPIIAGEQEIPDVLRWIRGG